MEPAVITLERRGRKRKRKDVENVLADPQPKKQLVEIRSMVLVGRYVKKEFEGSGNFIGKIVYYDTGLYRIDYEDGDCEDLESAEVRKLLIRDGDLDGDLIVRKNKLDELLAKKYVKDMDIVNGKVKDLVNVADMVKASLPNELSDDGDNEIDVQIDDDDADSSSDSCEHTCDHDFSSEADAPFVPPPQLPPSSGNIGVPEECVSHLFSVYGFFFRSVFSCF
ncbi:DDT domain-containing protein PTM [Camellia lanceoleosa]|uniref:DDT domain-containing protein PTM n=1 Tax=Camellia lanceoleosa TaxID=1840588 RepID=A0ACC0FTN6_9ERIC|nr:DDT domain-containing protein PTM [Camellia lanceoleosa]